MEKLDILVVDDSPEVRIVLQKLMESFGHNVELAENGMKAVILIENKNKRYDLIITDYDMPILNGLGVIRRVRATVPNARIWLTSGLLHDHIAKQALDLGAERALHKADLNVELKSAGITT